MTESDRAAPDMKKVYNKLEEMDNKLERIKGDTHNLSRVASLTNKSLIIQEISKIIGTSAVRAAILHLTKDEISAGDLAKAIGIAPSNLARDIQPFLGNKEYIAVIKRGTMRFFQRSELVDLVGFESIKEFADLIEEWQKKRALTPSQTTQTTSEDANVHKP